MNPTPVIFGLAILVGGFLVVRLIRWFAVVGSLSSFGRSDLYKHLNNLISYALDSDVMVIEYPETGSFVQFRKYISNKTNFGLDIAIPMVLWDDEREKNLLITCNDLKLNYRIVATKNGWNFCFVDLGNDFDTYPRILPAILDLLGLPDNPSMRMSPEYIYTAKKRGLVLGNQPKNISSRSRYRI